jgi:lipopolysaccharide biosynthesis glycosyltransferase
MIRLFIGFDRRETAAYHALSQSILANASAPLAITPLHIDHLTGVFTREPDPLQSTDFAFSRFLTPYLCGFEGWAIFMDCDMIMRDDIAKLWTLRDDRYAVQVVKHDHQPREATKFLGQQQTRYAKKNWSSVMLFNNGRCDALTPAYVDTASGLQLHQFKWLDNDDLIGALPARWNHLVGYDEASDDIAVLHYTTGGPYFAGYANTPHADKWFYYRDQMNAVAMRKPRLVATGANG